MLAKKFDEASGQDFLQYKFSNGTDMSTEVPGPQEIYLEASRLTFADPTQQFILKADKTLQFEKVDELLDTLRKADVQKVLLLSQQKTK